MAERMVLGVDFSGGETDNSTQVTQGVLRGSDLELKPRVSLPKRLPATHDKLKELIRSLPSDAVVALDFPFSVPRTFADALTDAQKKDKALQMSDLWAIVAEEEMNYNCFEELRDSFVKRHGEAMRRGDVYFAGPFSPLHTVNPSMLKMTYHGMRMLHELREAGCRIPPLPDGKCDGPILLETMPGVLLRTFGLPATNYKTNNKTNNGNPETVRREILDGLEFNSGVNLENFDDDIKLEFVKNHDKLDSLVAAVGAAMWAMSESKFLTPRKSIPQSEEYDYAQIEGWIYAPRK